MTFRTVRTWIAAAFAVGLVSLSGAPSLADSRASAARMAQPAARMEAQRIAQARSARAVRAEPPPAPARTKQAKLEPKPPADGARQAGSQTARSTRNRGR
ncbi:MAG: hypothetical protein ABW352_11245 [Polyangiales bacterium]